MRRGRPPLNRAAQDNSLREDLDRLYEMVEALIAAQRRQEERRELPGPPPLAQVEPPLQQADPEPPRQEPVPPQYHPAPQPRYDPVPQPRYQQVPPQHIPVPPPHQQAPPQSPPVHPQPAPVPLPRDPAPSLIDPGFIERYRRLNPSTFSGGSSFEEAQYWLAETERAFETLGVIPEQRAAIASYMLVGEAVRWWELKRATLPVPVTWEQFLAAFHAEYLPKHIQHLKEIEFAQLVQGNMTVSEYARKFLELGRHAPETLLDEGRKARKFQWGLRPEIRQHLLVMELETYSAVLAKAQIIERSFDTRPQLAGSSRPSAPLRRPAPTMPVQPSKRPRPAVQAPPQAMGAARGKICQYCGRDHGDRPCYRLNNTCRICGSAQHYARECPRNQNQGRPPIQGRVYNLTQKDADADPDVVHGMYTISGHIAHILFDTGASHSFISHVLASKICVSPDRLDSLLFVSTAGGETLLGEVVYRACAVEIADRKLRVDLIGLDTGDFDVILGMDWLAAYHATIDCFNKKIVFNPPNEEPFTS